MEETTTSLEELQNDLADVKNDFERIETSYYQAKNQSSAFPIFQIDNPLWWGLITILGIILVLLIQLRFGLRGVKTTKKAPKKPLNEGKDIEEESHVVPVSRVNVKPLEKALVKSRKAVKIKVRKYKSKK